jgi:CRISPR/Cas system-associated exonuclease Cas4 (RecB family)
MKYAHRPRVKDNFLRDSTASMGTAVHAALQKWFGIVAKNYLYGNYVCKPCRKIRRHCFGMQECQLCGEEMVYEEYSVSKTQDTPFTGHIDGIMVLPHANYLIDFKGSSLEAMRSIEKNKQPYLKHYCQTNAYANAVAQPDQDFGEVTHIDKIVIIYLRRDKPAWDWTALQVPVSARIYRETLSYLKEGHRSLEELRIPRGFCDSPRDQHAKYCPFKEVCFSPLLETMLEDEILPQVKTKRTSIIEKALAT